MSTIRVTVMVAICGCFELGERAVRYPCKATGRCISAAISSASGRDRKSIVLWIKDGIRITKESRRARK
jgi:hypothetical protein